MIALNLLAPSLLNFYHWSPSFARWQSFLAHIVDLHARIVGPFTTRPVTTYLIQGLSSLLSLSHWWGFLLAQLLLLTGAAWALGRLSERLGGKPLLSLVVFFSSFTLLFSFVTPNDSYDEAAQYLFLFLALDSIASRRDFLFAVFFFFALLTRETSAILIPSLVLIGWSGWRSSWKFILPLAFFCLYYFTKEADPDPNRFFYWSRNFRNPITAFESLVSLLLALALPGAMLTVAIRSGWAKAGDPWIRAFFLAVAINSVMVALSAYARESRLLALPLVLLWPLAGSYLSALLEAWRQGCLRISAPPVFWVSAAISFVAIACLYSPGYRFPLYPVLAQAYFLLFVSLAALKSTQGKIEPAAKRASKESQRISASASK